MCDVTYSSRPILLSTEERSDGKVPTESEAVHPLSQIKHRTAIPPLLHNTRKDRHEGQTAVCAPTLTAVPLRTARSGDNPTSTDG